jgi:hypothetical protein
LEVGVAHLIKMTFRKLVENMRMIGIGLLGFLLAGVALLLSTMNLWDRARWAVQTQMNGPQLVFETPAAMPVSDQNTSVIARSNPDNSVILTGFPAYQSVTFNLPLNARATSGYLQIDATLQVLAGVEGVLRISIDNMCRAEMLLHPGVVGRSLQVPLSPTDLAREQLVVSFSLQGNGPPTQCQTDTGLAAIVEIETTSAVHLTLDRPLTTARDRVNAWGGVVRVGWPQWLEPMEQARRLVLAAQFKQHGVPTVFIEGHSADALSTGELRQAFPQLAHGRPAPTEMTWPRKVAATGANAGLRRFHDATRWRINVDLRGDPEMRIPSTLDLRLTLGRQAIADQWSVVVTVNERLVFEDLLDRTETGLAQRIPLPAEMIAASNLIEVTVASTRRQGTACNLLIELIAEMLPETTLIAGDAAFSDALSQLQKHLADLGQLRVGTMSVLNAADADAASDLIARVVPVGVTLKPQTQRAEIVVVTPNDTLVALPDTAPMWFVSRDVTARDLTITPLTAKAILSPRTIGLLIVTGGIDLAEISL